MYYFIAKYGIQDKNTAVLHIFDWVIFYYLLQLIFRLTPLTSAAESNEKLANQN
jgi:hypothetical protein